MGSTPRKEPGTAEHSRAPAIWSGTQEILADLSVMDRFEAEGITLPCLKMWVADHKRVLLRLPIEELRDETPYPHLLILPQSKTEHFLYEAIRDTTEAEALLEALAEDNSTSLVEYARQRRQAIEEGVNPFTDRLTRLLLLGKGRWLRPALLVANLLLRIRPFRRRVLRRLARLQES